MRTDEAESRASASASHNFLAIPMSDSILAGLQALGHRFPDLLLLDLCRRQRLAAQPINIDALSDRSIRGWRDKFYLLTIVTLL